MSDLGELFSGYRKARQQKRADNRDSSRQMLTAAGVKFTEHNSGAHLVVTGDRGHVVDFWPGTGLWRMRGSTQSHRGIKSLVRFVVSVKETPNA